MNNQQKVEHICLKFGIGKAEAVRIVKSIDLKAQAANASTVDELKSVILKLIERQYPADDITTKVEEYLTLEL